MKMWQERNRRQTSSPSEIPAEYYKQAKVYGKANVGKLEDTTGKTKRGR